MPDIMQQACNHHQLPLFIREADLVRDLARDIAATQAMVETGMHGPGKNEIPHSQLFDMPQALKIGTVYEWLHPGIFDGSELHGAMHRIFDDVKQVVHDYTFPSASSAC